MTINIGSSGNNYLLTLNFGGTIQGGASYDQDLNTTDDVEFNSITANLIIAPDIDCGDASSTDTFFIDGGTA